MADQIKRLVGDLIEREVHDPRVGFTTVTGVEVSPDYSVARVYVTVGQQEDPQRSLQGLSAASGFLRARLAERLSLRQTPELRFFYDESIDQGFRMDAILKRIAEERNDVD